MFNPSTQTTVQQYEEIASSDPQPQRLIFGDHLPPYSATLEEYLQRGTKFIALYNAATSLRRDIEFGLGIGRSKEPKEVPSPLCYYRGRLRETATMGEEDKKIYLNNAREIRNNADYPWHELFP